MTDQPEMPDAAKRLAITTGGLLTALEIALVAGARPQGANAKAWLNEVEAAIQKEVQSVEVVGIDIGIEADGTTNAVAIIQLAFRKARAVLGL